MTDYARASALHGLVVFAASQNLDAQALLQDAGLPADVLDYPENFISYRNILNVLELGAQRSGNPLFGLQLGLQQSLVGTVGPLLYLARNSATVGEALHALGRYFHVHASSAKVYLEIEGEHALFYYDPGESADLTSLRPITELAVGGGLQMMRTLLGSRWQPQALMLQHAPAREPQVYHRLLGLTPTFNAPFNAWVFDAKLLSIPLHAADQELHRLIRQHLDGLEQITVQDLPTHVQQIIRSFLPQGRVSVEQVADYLALSSRSLQRYLAEEGTSFQLILDQTRQAMANRYLSDSAISFTQLSGLLGYAELSAFSRAFQRWYGMSPRAWKRQQGQGQARRRLIRPRR